jgi:hypothetical protein
MSSFESSLRLSQRRASGQLRHESVAGTCFFSPHAERKSAIFLVALGKSAKQGE